MAGDAKTPEAFVLEVTEKTLDYVQKLQRELARLEDKVRSLEVENDTLRAQADVREPEMRQRFAAIKQEHADLATLYVASHRLHEAIERAEVLGVIQEIVANLIGSEEIAVFEVSENGQLEAVRLAGLDDPAPFRALSVDEGLIGHSVKSGEVLVRAEGDAAGALPHEAGLTVCIPLSLRGKVVGLIAVFRLLPQKSQLTRLDHELFALLQTHAAVALYASGLHSRSAPSSAAMHTS